MSALEKRPHASDAVVREHALLLEIPRATFDKIYAAATPLSSKLHRFIEKSLLLSLAESNRHLARLISQSRLRGANKEGDELEKTPADGPLRFAVAHANAPQTARELAELVKRVRPQAVLELVGQLGAVIGTYGGPGAFGVMWVPEPPSSARAEPPSEAER